MPIVDDVVLGARVRIPHPTFVNLYGCSVSDETLAGTFVEIQSGVVIRRRCKVSSHTFLCTGVQILDEVFVGHGVMFVNDLVPCATNPDGSLQAAGDWTVVPTVVCRRASIGSGVIIVGGVRIVEEALVGVGAVVTKDVPDGAETEWLPSELLSLPMVPEISVAMVDEVCEALGAAVEP